MGDMNTDIDSRDPINSQYKFMPCRYCDKPIQVSIRRKSEPAHTECSIQAAIDQQQQMRDKSGPYYDAWLKSMSKKFETPPGGGVG